MGNSSHFPKTRKKRILLVALASKEFNLWTLSEVGKIAGVRSSTPPLGLLTIAALIPSEEYDLRFVDLGVGELSDSDLRWADYLFLSNMFNLEDENGVFGKAREFGLSVVMGGAIITEHYMNYADDIHLVIGEAEALMPRLLEDLTAGTLRRAYGSSCSREMLDKLRSYFGDDIFLLPPGELPSLKEPPVPRFDLLDMNAYFMMAVQTTRGCPMNCDFCTIWQRFGRKPRTKPIPAIIAELDELYRLGWRSDIVLSDDNTFGDKVFFNHLLDALIPWQRRQNREISFITQASLNLADDPDLLKRMRAARITTHFIGFESAEPEALLEVNKSVNLAGDTRKRVITLQQNGMGIYAGVIVGFDSDPDDVDRRLCNTFQDLAIHGIMLSVLYAPPGTVLFARLDSESRINKSLQGATWMPFIPNIFHNRPTQAVMRSYRRALNALYPRDMKAYFERCITYYTRLSDAKLEPPMEALARLAPDVEPLSGKKGFSATENFSLAALFSLARRRVFSASFPESLRFLWRVRRQWPEHLDSAFINMLMGFHFQTVAQSYCEAAEVWDFLFDRLAWLNNSLGLEFATPTKMAGDLTPDRYFVEMPALPPRKEILVPPEEAAALEREALRAAENRYRRLSPTAKSFLNEDYRRFKEDVGTCVARIGNSTKS